MIEPIIVEMRLCRQLADDNVQLQSVGVVVLIVPRRQKGQLGDVQNGTFVEQSNIIKLPLIGR